MAIQAIRNVFNMDGTPADVPAGPDASLAHGQPWPPTKADAARIAMYDRYRMLWEGDHQHVLVKQNTVVYGEYISVNIPKIIVTIPADLLFGEDLTLVYDDEADQGKRERVEAIWRRNDMQTLLYENALDTGYSGDGVWSVGLVVSDDGAKAKAESVIKTHPADTWYPEQAPDDVRQILRHRLTWEKKHKPDGGKEQTFLRVVVHEKGEVLHELYLLNDKGNIEREASDAEWAYFYDQRPTSPQIGIPDEFLLEHVPNFRTARQYKGQSEYVGLEDLFATINMHVTQTSGILDRHSDPKMGVPPEVWARLTMGGKRDPDISDLQVVPASDNGDMPMYLTWDGKLTDNKDFINMVMGMIAVVSETAPQLMNTGEWGGDLSGRALKILLLRTLAKVSRKRRYYSRVIPELLRKAQILEGEKDPLDVGLEWPDGLPADVLEQVEEVDRRLANGTLDRKSAVKRLDGVGEDQAQAILDEIEEQDPEPTIGNGARQKPTIPVTINQGDV